MFEITAKIEFRNIKFIGNDLNLIPNIILDKECYNTTKICCEESKLLNISGRCSLKEKKIIRNKNNKIEKFFLLE